MSDLQNLPSNSNEARPQGRIRTKKQASPFARDIRDMSSSLFESVLLPAIKGLITDFINSAVDLVLYGDSGRPRSGSRRVTSYNNMYRGRPGRKRAQVTRHVSLHDQLNLGDIYFETQQEAQAVLEDVVRHTSKYSWLSVGDLLSFSGLPSNKQIYDHWGWTNMSGIKITRIREGWLLDMPDPEYAE